MTSAYLNDKGGNTTMTAKRRILIVCAVIAILFLLMGWITLTQFFSPGIHYLGRAVHLQTSESCYLIQDNRIIGKTVLSVDGTSSGIPRHGAYSHFQGYFNVEAYPVPMSDAMATLNSSQSGGFLMRKDGDYLDILYTTLNEWLSRETCEEDYWYILTLNKNKKDMLIIQIMDSEGTVAMGVTAPSEDEALQSLNEYLNDRYPN